MELAQRAGVIASLQLLNNQLRSIDQNAAWTDSEIASTRDLDALREKISAALFSAQSQKPAKEQEENPLRAELEGMSGKEIAAVFDAMNLAGSRMAFSEKVEALLAESQAEVRAAIDSISTSAAKEPWQMTEAEFGEVERQKALAIINFVLEQA